MFSLVYRSKAIPIFGPGQIQDMLQHAKRFNNKNNITGCLLYYEGEFLQYLEGDQDIIWALFDNIKNDDRHTNINLLCHGDITSREFETWDMAYEDFLGTNYQLEYLKLLVGSFVEDPDKALDPNPTSRNFWITAQLLLKAKSLKNS